MKGPFRLPDDPRRAGADVEREIELHIELRAREFEAQGMSAEDARRAALASFGDRDGISRECADVRSDTLKARGRRLARGDWAHDIRAALRGFRRSPGFVVLALLTLGLGIGANAALFSVVRSVLLRPLPYPDAGRLVQLWTDERSTGREAPEWLTPPDFEDWRRDNTTFAEMASYRGWGPDLTGSGDPESLRGVAVSAGFFDVLGIGPALGRGFTAADDDPGAERVTILSDGLWRRRFGADRNILGRAITLNGEPWTVVGVLPRDFRSPTPFAAELFRPSRLTAGQCGRGCIVLQAIGRLRPGVAVETAEADLDAIAARLAREYPGSNEGRSAWVVPLHEQVTGSVRPALIALSVAVGFVLLVACVNLATLLLVRGAGRSRELAVRAALGAGRGRLVRQLLVESLLLAGIGGVIGLGAAYLVVGVVGSLVPASVRDVQVIAVDGWVIGFSVAVAMLSGTLFGLAPALQAVSGDMLSILKSGNRTDLRHGARLRSALVVAQLALAVMLLTGAGLLLRSLLALQQVNLGYRTAGLIDLPVAFPGARYGDNDRVRAAIDDLLGRLRSSGAIRGAEITDVAPLTAGDQDIGAAAVGEPAQPNPPSLWYRSVTPGYLELLGVPIVKGRGFLPTDVTSGAPVAIVNEETARRLWRGADPIGRELTNSQMRVTVVGVVANVRHDGPHLPYKTELFLPFSQLPSRGVSVLIDPAGGDDAAIAAFRAALAAVDPLIPVGAVSPLERRLAGAVELPRLYALLVTGLAAAGLGLAALGVFGVMAYAVTLRRRELGVRLALGAGPRSLRNLVLGQGVRLAALGMAVGLVGALLMSRLLGALMFGVSPTDPVTYGMVALVLGLVTVLAAWIPATRAMRVDPLVTMRDD